jgi:hypothetical protein
VRCDYTRNTGDRLRGNPVSISLIAELGLLRYDLSLQAQSSGEKWKGIKSNLLAADFLQQPGPGEAPVPQHRVTRDLQYFSSFLHAEPGEEAEFDNLSLSLIDLG